MHARGWSLSFALGVTLAAVAPACVGGGAESECYPGAEGCTCVEPNLCAEGLSCVSGFCVYVGSEGGNEGDGDTGDGDTGDGDSVNLCELLIECVKEVQPEALSSYVTLYGASGECYEIDGLTKEDCWAECDAIRESLALAFPEVAQCASYNCGDGKLNSDEMCDGTSDCTATCTFENLFDSNECNPVTQAHCDPTTERCGISYGEWDYSFFCRNAIGEPTAALNESCSTDGQCADPSHLCVARPDCVDTACCTATCYLGPTDEDYGDCPAGYTCTSVTSLYTVNPWPSGSNLIGLCW